MGKVNYPYTHKRKESDVSTLPTDCTADDIRSLWHEITDILEYLVQDEGIAVQGTLDAVRKGVPGAAQLVIATANNIENNDNAVISLMADCAAKIMATHA